MYYRRLTLYSTSFVIYLIVQRDSRGRNRIMRTEEQRSIANEILENVSPYARDIGSSSGLDPFFRLAEKPREVVGKLGSAFPVMPR